MLLSLLSLPVNLYIQASDAKTNMQEAMKEYAVRLAAGLDTEQRGASVWLFYNNEATWAKRMHILVVLWNTIRTAPAKRKKNGTA